MWEKEKRAIEISHHLKQAIEGGEIQPWFQPQYDYRHGKLIGAEVLTRWVHPEYGNIYQMNLSMFWKSPDRFWSWMHLSGKERASIFVNGRMQAIECHFRLICREKMCMDTDC